MKLNFRSYSSIHVSRCGNIFLFSVIFTMLMFVVVNFSVMFTDFGQVNNPLSGVRYLNRHCMKVKFVFFQDEAVIIAAGLTNKPIFTAPFDLKQKAFAHKLFWAGKLVPFICNIKFSFCIKTGHLLNCPKLSLMIWSRAAGNLKSEPPTPAPKPRKNKQFY